MHKQVHDEGREKSEGDKISESTGSRYYYGNWIIRSIAVDQVCHQLDISPIQKGLEVEGL